MWGQTGNSVGQRWGTVMCAGVRVDRERHTLAVQVVGKTLHAPRPQRQVLLQLVRHRVAPNPVGADGRHEGVSSCNHAALHHGICNRLVLLPAAAHGPAVDGEGVPGVPSPVQSGGGREGQARALGYCCSRVSPLAPSLAMLTGIHAVWRGRDGGKG